MDAADLAYLQQAEAHADEGPLGEPAARSILAIALRYASAIEAIAACRGVEGYGWNITALNKALDAALPTIGREPPPRFQSKQPLRAMDEPA